MKPSQRGIIAIRPGGIAPPPPPPPPPSGTYRPYVDTSKFNLPIPAGTAYHPDSAIMLSASSGWLLGGTSSSAYQEWIGPRERLIYFRGDTSKLTKVAVYPNWTPNGGFKCATTPLMVPMPSYFATILSGGAGHFDGDRFASIVDSITGDVWEAAQLTPPGTASTYGITCDSNRWNANEGLSFWPKDTVSGNGYSELNNAGQIAGGHPSESYCHAPAGILTPEDFADCFSGSDPGTAVEHVTYLEGLAYNWSTAHSWPHWVSPARSGIGVASQPACNNAVVYGARIQLDPAINVGSWASVNAKPEPWRSGLKKLLRGFQKYGLWIQDDVGGVGAGGVAACHPYSISQGSYNGQTGWKYPWDAAGYGWSYNNGIPYDLMSHFHVIDWTKF